MSHDVFVSYSTDDKQVADTLVSTLEQQGIRCWYAPRDIRPGADWGESIYQSILGCEVFLLVFSSSSNRSHRVLDELNLAIEEEKIILPFRIENINPSGALRLHLTTRHWLDAYDPSWDRFLDRLVENVGANLKKWRPEKPVSEDKLARNIVLPQPTPDSQEISRLVEKKEVHTTSAAEVNKQAVYVDKKIHEPHKKNILVPIVGGLIGVVVLVVLILQRGRIKTNLLEPSSLPTQATAVAKAESPPNATAKPEPTSTPKQVISAPELRIPIMISFKDEMTQLYVPAGDFPMGASSSDINEIFEDCKNCPNLGDLKNATPQHSVYLDAFWIDRTEVSNEQYRRCVTAGACTEPMSDNYWNEDYSDYPVVNVNWQQANEYCLWAGRRLPSEAEWEKAARGADGRLYPWGNTEPAENLLNFLPSVGTKPVGSYPEGAGPYGALDMAGNVWEWTADWFAPDYYSVSPSENPTGPSTGNIKVVRGGSWGDVSGLTSSLYRHTGEPGFFEEYMGFRCVDTDADALLGVMKDGTVGSPQLFIPAGEFAMGEQDNTEDRPLHMVELDAFFIDAIEVTVGQYKQCMAQGACKTPSKEFTVSGKDYFIDPQFENYPVVGVNWEQANAYCQWLGRRLPTEAEWEKAARGTDGRRYPWGDKFDGSKGNFCDINCVTYDYRDMTWDDGFAETSPVGSFPQGASPYGVLDMAGNVWEWVSDWYAEDYYSFSIPKNPKGPVSGTKGVLRGGCWGDIIGQGLIEVYFRLNDLTHDLADNAVGFRCAADFYPPE